MLSIFYAFEFSAYISRRAGYTIDNPTAGLFFQNSLSVFSRLIMFVFMPLIGFLSDTNKLDMGFGILFFLLIPLAVFICFKFKKKIEIIYGNIILRLHENGSYLKKAKQKFQPINVNRGFITKKFKLLIILVNIPFYLSWVLILIFLIEYNQYRATVISFGSLLNGIYTLSISLVIDPFLSRIGNYQNLILVTYDELLKAKLISSIVSGLIIISIYTIYTISKKC